MTTTEILGLRLPLETEYYSLTNHWNYNSQKLEEYAESLTGAAGVVTSLQAAVTALAGGVHLRGAVNYYADLPVTPAEGDAYTVLYAGSSGTTPNGIEYAWADYEGTLQWVPIGVDPSVFARQADLTALQTTVEGKANSSALTAETNARTAADTAQMNGIIGLINEGAKNVLDISSTQTQSAGSLTFTVNPDFSVTLTGKNDTGSAAFFSVPVTFPGGAYYFCGMPETGGSGSYRLELRTGTASGSVFQTCESATPTAFTRDNPWTGYFNIRVANGHEFTTAKTVKPMISERWKYALTDQYVPYRPSLNDLWAMIQAQA